MTSFYTFYFTDPATTEIYTLSLHDALPIYADRGPRPELPRAASRLAHRLPPRPGLPGGASGPDHGVQVAAAPLDRKSTRLNSSHTVISYAVFCLKKKN